MGTNDISVHLSRYDLGQDSLLSKKQQWSSNWNGHQGNVIFTPLPAGTYQVNLEVPDGYITWPDTLIDSLGYSDTLLINSDTVIDLGLISLLPLSEETHTSPLSLEESLVADSQMQRPIDSKAQSGSAKWTIYPNPASNYVTVDSDKERVQKCYLFDYSGKMVNTGSGTSHSTIDLQGLRTGLFTIQIIPVQGNHVVKKLVIVR